jgi:murein DD-endopeptidase MepM/ murein hydrolase activator NlpD
VRSGIAAYITRSFDPNSPGDYNTSAGVDNDSSEEIKQLADKELKNISDDILSNLSAEDYSELKRFCRFINNLLDPSGEKMLSSGVQIDIPNDISTLKAFRPLITKANGEIENLGTIEQEFKKFVSPNSLFHEGSPKGLTDSISFDTFTAGYLYNNNTLWTFPGFSNLYDKYTYVLFNNSNDRSLIDGTMNNDSDSEFNNTKDKEDSYPKGIVKVSNGSSDKNKNPDEYQRLEAINNRIDKRLVLDYSRLQNINNIPLNLVGNVYYPDLDTINDGKGVVVTSAITENNIGNGVTYLIYSHVTTDTQPYLTWGLFKNDFGSDRRGTNQRIFLRRICTDLENRMSKIEDEKNNILSQVLGKAQSSENSLYIQMHHIFHQWGVLGYSMDSATVSTNKNSNGTDRISEQQVAPTGQIAVTLEKTYGDIVEIGPDGKLIATRNVGDDANVPIAPGGAAASMGFRYDFPMERINPPVDTPKTNVAHSIINIEPLYSPNANTTLLNIIQQICSKNNFMFVPIPGNLDYTNISNIFEPSLGGPTNVGNIFHVLFTPTPENRSRQNNGESLSLSIPQKNNFDAFEIEFGSVDNSIIKNIQVSTTDDRPTAESILNLQRLVDKDNSNKAVTTDCSVLSVMEGRSYKMQVDMLGNAQVSPMQYFYVPQMPIFSGLYQIMNVKHSITVNNMATSFEGVKMRFDGSQMKGVAPITLESLKALGSTSNTSQPLVGSSSPNPAPPAPLVPEPMEQRITNNDSNKNTPVSNNNTTNTKGIYLPGGKGPKTQDPVLDSLVNGYVNEARYRKILNSLPSKSTKETLLAIDAPDFQMPMSYTKVSSKFGLRSYNAKTGKNDPDNPDFHPGIDLVGSPNTEIRSIADGTVYLARRISSREETITLSTLAISETETRITGSRVIGKKTDGTDYISNAASTGFIKYIKNLGTTYEVKVNWTTPDVGMGAGYGQVVIVKHNSRFYSLYAHLNEVKVNKGQTIKKGDPIGTQGNTMDGVIRSTGAHLHFEIWDKSVCNADFACAVNPEHYLTV